MSTKRDQFLEHLRGKRVGIFVDDSNLYHSYQKYGWRIDFGKLRLFLERFCMVQFIHYHVAIPHRSDAAMQGTEQFLKKITPYVTLKRKDLKYTPIGGKFIKKADVDVEITLDVVRTIDTIDLVVLMSGDSDFLELKNYAVRDQRKQIIFFAFEKNMAWEFKQYCWHLYLDDYRGDLELVQNKNNPQVGPKPSLG